ncbi:alanine--tRNA ligase [Thermosulfuriphilus sp.]
MKILKGADIRRLFLEFFAERGHEIVPSSPLIPAEDPTLLFTNAGMVQFKRVFLGQEKRSYCRAASCQKCVRAGGKHNDLENVGYTARHHTFFEMLGNFSFGDYFKAEAIKYAWDFLTEILELPKDRLWVTVFREDEEAAKLWTEIAKVPPERIIPLGEKDNFWSMGETGPCGPCSEIIFDQGPEVGCQRPECAVGCDCDRYLEIWNLVFMQYNRTNEGRLEPLPRPSIDTGMGLERITATVQGKRSNYESDLFAGLLKKLEILSGHRYGQEERLDVAMRVIADHSRAAAFLIADGVLPSNEGRGYVLRRIIRRAARFGKLLSLSSPFLPETAAVVISEMGETYPELHQNQTTIEKVLEYEEERFGETLEFGLKLLSEEIENLKKRGEKTIPGEFIFRLYDTYGFPYDIVRDMALEQGLTLDMEGFSRQMEKQRARSRAARKERDLLAAEIYQELAQKGQGSRFVGYETTRVRSRLLAIVKKGLPQDSAREGEEVELVFEKTPFYGEAGGQVGDTGLIVGPSGRGRVKNTVRVGDVFVHQAQIEEGLLHCGEEYELTVLVDRRQAIACNHTATHLLHAALRAVLGGHVKQAGSLVAPDRLRFDFTHFEALSLEQLFAIEDLVNEKIRQDLPVEVEHLSLKEALARGAMALFGEKYGETVRLVSIPGFSQELCGGTHVRRTGEIGLFKIISEASVASGTRRIEAVTAKAAIDFIHNLERERLRLSALLKTSPKEITSRVERLLNELKELERKIEHLATQGAALDIDREIAAAPVVAGVKVVSTKVPLDDPKLLREMGDRFRDKLGSGVVVLGAEARGKAHLLVMVTQDLTSRLKAGEIIRELAQIVGGGGGGRPEMAQAGGPEVAKLPEALKKASEVIEKRLS